MKIKREFEYERNKLVNLQFFNNKNNNNNLDILLFIMI